MKENNSIIAFHYGNGPVRIVTDSSGNCWWVAADVCAILGIANPRDAVSALDDDEKNTVRISDSIPTPGNPNMNVINESGLYTLIFRSNKAEAAAFRKWVPSTVIPAIRKTGGFASGKSVAKLTIFLNDVATAGFCSFDTLKEYCWLRTLGLPLDMAGRASNMGATHHIQAVDRKLKAVGIRFPNLLFASRRKLMDDAFEKLLAEAEMNAVGDALAAKEVANG